MKVMGTVRKGIVFELVGFSGSYTNGRVARLGRLAFGSN